MPYRNTEEYRAWARADYAKHAETRRAAKRRHRAGETGKRSYRNWSYKKKYGITIEDYEALYKKQNGLCAICSQPPKLEEHLHVDHDHETNKVRGLLCSGCNTALGGFKDDPDILVAAAEYLKRSM